MDIAVLQEAVAAFEQRLSEVEASQWGRATPCADWDVRELVNHVVGELLWMPPLLESKTIADVGDQFDGDILGESPLDTARKAGAEALAFASAPDAQNRTVHLSFGEVPGGEYIGQVTSDVIVHTWDLSKALGADDAIAPGLFEFVDSFLGPQIEAWRAGGAFGPAFEVGSDASPQDRFIADTGRNPSWSL